jgi:amidase
LDVWQLLDPSVAEALAEPAARIERHLGGAAGCTAALQSFDAMYWSFRFLQGREAWISDGAFIECYAPPLGPGVAERFAWSKQVTDRQVADAAAFRNGYRAHLADLLGRDGVLLMPTMPDVAPLLAADESALEAYRNDAIRMLCISGLAGFPQLTLPLASRLGVPLGISLLGPAGSDRSLVALAAAIGS